VLLSWPGSSWAKGDADADDLSFLLAVAVAGALTEGPPGRLLFPAGGSDEGLVPRLCRPPARP
jgi:hypothetical protein